MAISSMAGLMAHGSPGDPTSGPMGSPSGAMPSPGGGGGGGGKSAQAGLNTVGQGADTISQALNRASDYLGSGNPNFKKGGKVSSKGRDWHGFGSSKTGNNNHGF